MAKRKTTKAIAKRTVADAYAAVLADVVDLLEQVPADGGAGGECRHDDDVLARRRRIVEGEQSGAGRAGYADQLLATALPTT